ncbi:CAP domain-containing protein [Streptomyces sp. NPDC002888]|uniref:CAP domain-containing protein n=1 Tax=Streptomyces sp. NPDC002888 TaxID=3364668 RepID=UPI0036D0FDEB
MGRHRRHAAGRAATGRATGVTETDGFSAGGRDPQDSYEGDHATMGIAPYLRPEAYAETDTKSHDYLFATDDDYAHATGTDATAAFPADGYTPSGGSAARGRRRKRKAATSVRAGLLGVSAAVAIGTVAVASGVVPGLENYKLGGDSGGEATQAVDTPTNADTQQGGTSGPASASDDSRGGTATSRDSERSASPSTSPSPSPSTSTASATPTEKPTEKPTVTPSKKPRPTPSRTATKEPERSSTPGTVSAEASAETEVLRLVNEERAKVGCSAVAANSALTKLATNFSDDMAARGFFDHTDPDGASPWDRAAKAGITDLGGENIARGQADAAAVMEAWMNSPGHRANILNCDFKTLGVGVHYGSGGPWWTQDFGY